MNKIILPLVLLTVVGCTTGPELHPEVVEVELSGMTIVGAEPIVPEHNMIEFNVIVTWFESKAELNRIYQRLCLDNINPCEKSVLGFTQVSFEDKACHIRALLPLDVDGDRTKVAGHEFLHCTFGAFHK
jgi:hypothetical protein